MLQHSITNHSCPVDATAVGGDGGRDQGLRRRHLTSMGRRSLNFRVRQMARHPAFIVGLVVDFGSWAILAIAVAFAFRIHIARSLESTNPLLRVENPIKMVLPTPAQPSSPHACSATEPY